MIRRPAARLLSIAIVAAGACASEWDPTADVVREADRRWVRVHSDADYDIALDTAHIRRYLAADDALEVWYRTQHLKPRSRNGQVWDREITLSVLRCDGLLYKIVRVDMSEGAREPISRQRTEPWELGEQPWRQVEVGTIEEITARAACRLGGASTIRSLAEKSESRQADSR